MSLLDRVRNFLTPATAPSLEVEMSGEEASARDTGFEDRSAASSPYFASAHDVDPNDLRGGGMFSRFGGYFESASALMNMFTGQGTGRDPSTFNLWSTPRRLQQHERVGMGRNALLQQALGKVPNNATREGWKLVITDDRVEDKQAAAQAVQHYEQRLGLPQKINRALFRSKQHRQALVILGVDDGRAFDQPVDVENIRTIRWAVVIDSRDFQPYTLAGPNSQDYGNVEQYQITNINGILEDGLRYGEDSISYSPDEWEDAIRKEAEAQGSSGTMLVHVDRVLSFATPDYYSQLDSLQDSFGAFFSTMNGISTSARESSMFKYKLNKVKQTMWSKNADLARQHMNLVQRAKSAINAIVVDHDEDVEVLNRPLGGLADLANPIMAWVAASLSIPNTVFWQVSPGGFGKGESERETFHEDVNAFQVQTLTPQLTKFHGYVFVAGDGAEIPYDTQREIVYNDLTPPDEIKLSELRNKAIEDLLSLAEGGYITRNELRDAVAKLNAEFFPLELDEEFVEKPPPAQVGIFTGTVALMQAIYGEGAIPIDAARALLLALDPVHFTQTNIEQVIPDNGDEQPSAAAPAPASTATGGTPSSSASGTEPVDEEDGEHEPSEIDVLWSQAQPPEDAATAKELAQSEELGGVTSRQITLLGTRGKIPSYPNRGFKRDPLYSLEDVKRALLARQGLLPEPAQVEDPQDSGHAQGEAEDACKPAPATVVAADASAGSMCLMLPLPPKLARWVPYKAEDTSPPHVTLIYCKSVAHDLRSTLLAALAEVLASFEAPEVTVHGERVEYFETPKGRCAHVRASFEGQQRLFDALAEVFDSHDLVPNRFDGGYKPHVTLAYLGAGEDYEGPRPDGSWRAEEVATYGGGEPLAVLRFDATRKTGDSAEDGDSFFKQGSDPKVYTKPRMRNALRSRILREGKGGKPGQWSARKAQLLALEYKRCGGGYHDGAELYEIEDYLSAYAYVDTLADYDADATEAQRSLKKWTREDWQTCLPSGPSEKKAGSKRRYLPRRACENLTPVQRRATAAKKAEGAKKGKQFVANTKRAKKARRQATDDMLDVQQLFADLDFVEQYDAALVFVEAEDAAKKFADMSEEKREEYIDRAFKRFHEEVNMGAAELEAWSKTKWSKKASLSREPITRNLRLLRKRKDDWTLADARGAMKTVNFVSRMKGNARGEPVKIDGREGPSKRDISLKNWAFDPDK